MSVIDRELNEQQRTAVLHMEGPCMVLAGAGSGKTRVLTRRLVNLIDHGYPANSILAITFTNKAANEMKARVSAIIPDFAGQWVQTFHAACYRILRSDIHFLGYNRNFTIVDDTDSKAVVRTLLREENDYETKPEELTYLFKQVKNSLTEPEAYFNRMGLPGFIIERNLRLFRLYNTRLKGLNALDFEDLINKCIELFADYPEVLNKYQQWFKFIMIDEYQDTNYAQYVWAKLLADVHKNIFVVGDPDQSIYSWRGAEPYNIIRFLTDYPDAKVIKLEHNYRSYQNILAAANAVIANNQNREEKMLYSNRGPGDKITLFTAADSYKEAEFIANTIQENVRFKGRQYGDCAVFYRTNAQSRLLEEALLLKGIPYQIIGAHRFYDRKEVKDIVAYLRLACNNNDILSFRRVINTPRRGIGEKTVEKIEEYARKNGLPIMEVLAEPQMIPGINKKMVITLQEFFGIIAFLQTLAESEGQLREILEHAMDITGYIEDLKRSSPLEAETRIENLYELRSLAVEFEKEGGGSLEDFLAHIALQQETDNIDLSDSVLLMTYHGAKGLEFPVVFMTGLEEGVFPSYRSESLEDIEEERRLCYVGITRAMDKLYMTNAVIRLLYGYERNNSPSRFLMEIPEELLSTSRGIDLREGDKVFHRRFGIGTVTALQENDEIAIIEFVSAGQKMLRLDIAPLEKID
ncbi:MAG: UvrD-helicase domain-containing protein [Syntrophomonadaceae bacterium]|nr:UvrD-helicase domain-containing protein [Syntrophomonadaceae bacterium]